MKTKNVTRKIKVTATDIREGVMASPELCPISRAVHRSFRNAKRVSVSDGSIWINLPDGRYLHFDTNPCDKINDFICDFDSGDPVKPFTFTFKGE